MNFTEQDILAGMKCCLNDGYTCEDCPFQEQKHIHGETLQDIEVMENGQRYDDKDCVTWLLHYARELLLQKDEENEKRKKLHQESIKMNRRLLREKYSKFWEKLKNERG